VRAPLSYDDEQVVRLIAEGLTRWAIAERLSIPETDVRNVIRRLCKEYGVRMQKLPEAVGLPPLDDDE
jgi:DNA-binding NarL/FixJ family response regulator